MRGAETTPPGGGLQDTTLLPGEETLELLTGGLHLLGREVAPDGDLSMKFRQKLSRRREKG